MTLTEVFLHFTHHSLLITFFLVFLFFIKSLIIGFAISAPVGPIGLLCIQRSLRNGFKMGLITGMGAATADALYGFVAAFGLTALSGFLIRYQSWIHIIGGIFLILLGLKLILSKHLDYLKQNGIERSLWHAYGTTLFLTMMNPITVISFMAIFAGLGLGSQHHNYGHALILVLGIFLGSASWWLTLSSSVAFILHHRMQENSMDLINKISGSLFLLFGVVALIW
ncbi:MAG: LysE family transporter [Verrucomicrobiae bacterium]|nr:LysE family transporter [Verrucomicrobiae bacterium]